MSENPPLPLRPTSIACRSISGCRNGAAKTSSFPLCPDHRPGPTLLKNSFARSRKKLVALGCPINDFLQLGVHSLSRLVIAPNVYEVNVAHSDVLS